MLEGSVVGAIRSFEQGLLCCLVDCYRILQTAKEDRFGVVCVQARDWVCNNCNDKRYAAILADIRVLLRFVSNQPFETIGVDPECIGVKDDLYGFAARFHREYSKGNATSLHCGLGRNIGGFEPFSNV